MVFSTYQRMRAKGASWAGPSLHKIISYLLLVLLSMWNFHDTILVALNSGRQNTTFTVFEVMNSPAWISHVVISVGFLVTVLTSDYPLHLLKCLHCPIGFKKICIFPFQYGCSNSPVILVSIDYFYLCAFYRIYNIR